MIQANKQQLGIEDMQLRLTPLEEVFMSVARRAEVQHSQHMNETTDLVLEDGVTVEVSLSSSAVVFVKGCKHDKFADVGRCDDLSLMR